MEAMLFSRFLVWKWQFLNLYVESFVEDLRFIKLERICTSSNWRTSIYSPFMLAFQRRKLNLFGARTVCCKGAVIRKRTRIKASDPSIFEGFLLAFVTQYNLKKF